MYIVPVPIQVKKKKKSSWLVSYYNLIRQYNHECRSRWIWHLLPDQAGSLVLPIPVAHLAVKYHQPASQDLLSKNHCYPDGNIHLRDIEIDSEHWTTTECFPPTLSAVNSANIVQGSHNQQRSILPHLKLTPGRLGWWATVPICQASTPSATNLTS